MAIKETITTAPVPPRHDLYEHYAGNEFTNPELVDTALRVHAEGYTTMGFVSDDAIAPDGTLDETIDHSRGCFTDYYLAVNPGNARDMATMRKINIPPSGTVEDLPAFQLSKEGLYPEGISFLRNLESDGYHIKEIAGLARTKESPASSVYELLRSVLQEALHKDEVWLFSIVSSTFDSLTKYFGHTAFNVIGADVKINDYRVNERIQLRPSIVIPNMLFESMIRDVEHASSPKSQLKILGMFMYFTDGINEATMGERSAAYRRSLLALDGKG